MYQNEAEEIYDTWWGDNEAPWWTVSIGTMAFQVLYIMYLTQKYDSIKNFKALDSWIIAASLAPHLFCMSAIFISVSAPLFYYLTKILFAIYYYYANSGLLLRTI